MRTVRDEQTPTGMKKAGSMKWILISAGVVILLAAAVMGGYQYGLSHGRDYAIKHIEEYTTIIKAVPYSEVVRFVEEDKTETHEYTSSFDCRDFARVLKENANKRGLKCAAVVLTYSITGHVINAFDTTDKGIVYFNPQDDTFLEGMQEIGTEI